MTTVKEILQQSGIDEYSINSIDPQITSALQGVLTKAEQDKVSVNEFWEHTYNPGMQAAEKERQELAGKYARAEAEKAALLAERRALAESGIVGADLPISTGQTRNSGGQFAQTPGTPSFSGDANDIVSRASMGLAQIADVDYRHRALFNAPMPITPSQLIKEADARGIDPLSYAESRFGFSKKETEIAAQREKEREQAIRDDERRKLTSHYTDGGGSIDPMAHSRGAGMATIRKAQERGELRDPTKLTPEQRRTQALSSIHKAIAEREQRDA